MNYALFRFYAELNVFLPPVKRQTEFSYEFSGAPSIKDAIEAIGVPHTEVDVIVVNGQAVDFKYHIKENDRISVYPMFEAIEFSEISKIRPKPLSELKFIGDVHLGKLVKKLRLLGLDTFYRNDLTDPEIIAISVKEKRCILTKDRGLLKHKAVTHGHCVLAINPFEQVKEIIKRFNLKNHFAPFSRCIECNGLIHQVEKEAIFNRLESKTIAYFNEFFQCDLCKKVYWKGSHFEKMENFIKSMKEEK